MFYLLRFSCCIFRGRVSWILMSSASVSWLNCWVSVSELMFIPRSLPECENILHVAPRISQSTKNKDQNNITSEQSYRRVLNLLKISSSHQIKDDFSYPDSITQYSLVSKLRQTHTHMISNMNLNFRGIFFLHCKEDSRAHNTLTHIVLIDFIND